MGILSYTFPYKVIIIIIYLLLFRINFEFPSTGGVLTEATFETAKLLRYLSRTDYALLGMINLNHCYITIIISYNLLTLILSKKICTNDFVEF